MEKALHLHDHDIRAALRSRLQLFHADDPDTLILDELGLCKGAARVDIATVNGTLNGYEIKSQMDTLERLPWQKEIYSKVFDYITIVAGGRHVAKIMEVAPAWWGVEEVVDREGTLKFITLRGQSPNPNIDALSVAQLLWRDEVLEILKERGVDKGVKSKPREVLWQRLAESISINELRALVRCYLKKRTNWRIKAGYNSLSSSLPISEDPNNAERGATTFGS